MVAIVATTAYLGLEARGVEVQCQITPGVPRFIVVGLPDKAVGESRERVRAAIAAIGLSLPPKVITVNLSPADLPKEGSHYDLPIALALLGAMGVVDPETLASYVVVGELGLDGRVAASPGVLLAALHAGSVERGLVCPAAQGPRQRGPAMSRCSRRPTSCRCSIISRAARRSPRRGRGRSSRPSAPPTSRRSRDRRPRSARSRSPRRAAIIC